MPASTPPASRSMWLLAGGAGGPVAHRRSPTRLRQDGYGRRLPPVGGCPRAGTGLIGLSERAGLAGGQLDYETTARGQFRLRAWLPWPKEAGLTTGWRMSRRPGRRDRPQVAGPA